MSQTTAKTVLKDFGLTNKEAEVYIFLAKYDALTGGEIAKQTKIARSLVYRILKNLQNKSLVEPTLDSPTRFAAIPFEKALDLIIKTKQEEALQVQRAKKNLLEDWRTISQPKPKIKHEKFVVIEGSKNIYSKIVQMIKETKTSFFGLLTISTLARAEQFGVFETAYSYLLKSKTECQFVTNIIRQNLEVMKIIRPRLNSGINLKIRCNDAESNFPSVFIRDEEEILFFIRPEAKISKTKQDEVCIFTNCESLVQTFKNIFQDRWQKAIAVDDAIEKCKTEKLTTHTSSETGQIAETLVGTLAPELDDWDNQLESSIGKRINLLKEDEEEILDFASIVGEKFSFDMLEKVAGFNRVRLLKKLDALERKHQLIISDEEGYRFRHPTIKEMVYNKITPKLRKEYHFLIAKHLEAVKDLPEETVYELAYHYYSSGNSQKGVPFLLKAGEKARKEFLIFDAVEYYSQVLEMIGTGDEWHEDRIRAFENLGDLHSMMGKHDQANEFYAKGNADAIKDEIRNRIRKKMQRKVVIEEDGVKLNYFVYGEGKSVVVFVGYASHLMPQIHYFAQKHKVVLLDLSDNLRPRNHPIEYSVDYFIKCLKGAIDDLKTKEICLVGVGFGGTVAILYTTKYPEKVSKLSFLATCTRPAFGDSDYSKKQLDSFWAEAFLNPSWGVKEVNKHLAKIMDYAWSAYGVKDPQILGTFNAKDAQTRQLAEISALVPPEMRLICFKLSWEVDIRLFLDKIKIPTLILHGEKDVIPLKAVELMSKKIPRSKLCVLKQAHLISLFESEKVNRVLEDFFIKGDVKEAVA